MITRPHTTTPETATDRPAPTAPARRYGRYHATTAALSVTEVATLIIADLILISATPDTDSVFPARIRYAAEVYPRDNMIHILVFGLTDAELAAPYDHPADGSPCPVDYPEIITDSVTNAYGWDAADPHDRRFAVQVSTLRYGDQQCLAHRIGTITALRGHAPDGPDQDPR